MYYVGIDIGSTASKVVVRGEKELHFVLPTGWSSKETCQIIKEKLETENIDVLSDETKVVATVLRLSSQILLSQRLPVMQEEDAKWRVMTARSLT